MTPAGPAQGRGGRWRRWASLLREFGAGDGALYLLHRLLQRWGGERAGVVAYRLYAQPIGAGAYATVRDDPGTQFVELRPDDPAEAAFPRPAPIIRMRYASGSRCYAALVKSRFAGYIWISRNLHDEDEVRARYRLAEPAVSAWDFDVYVDPPLRMGRTLGRLWKAVDARLAADGVRWSFSRISRFNRRSQATHLRLGARCVGSATFFVAGPLQLMVASLAPYLHVGLHAHARPTLTLQPPR